MFQNDICITKNKKISMQIDSENNKKRNLTLSITNHCTCKFTIQYIKIFYFRHSNNNFSHTNANKKIFSLSISP